MWSLLLVCIIYSLSWHWASPVTRKEYLGWSHHESVALFKIILLIFQFLYSMSQHNEYLSTLPMLVWLTQGDIYPTTWFTQLLICVYLKQRPHFGPICIKIKSASLHYSLSCMGTITLVHLHWVLFHCRGLFSKSYSTPKGIVSYNTWVI